jgi:hypothetical protein
MLNPNIVLNDASYIWRAVHDNESITLPIDHVNGKCCGIALAESRDVNAPELKQAIFLFICVF